MRKAKMLLIVFLTAACMLQAQQPDGVIYKIGDAGSAGGIVFYDKGSYENGWRYLEAAPAETESTAVWGANENEVYTMQDVGSGKRNTQLIIERQRQLGKTSFDAQICADMEINGYKDWFLPSINELAFMLQNLKQKDLGGFSDNMYWSSSQLSGDLDSLSGLLALTQNDTSIGIYMVTQTATVRAVREF